ncbi:MAG: SAM hydroxide adenosyltransferase [Flavobacteriales bacterium]
MAGNIIYIDHFGNVVINIIKKLFEQVGKKNVFSRYRHVVTSSDRSIDTIPKRLKIRLKKRVIMVMPWLGLIRVVISRSLFTKAIPKQWEVPEHYSGSRREILYT